MYIRPVRDTDHDTLLALWERSVRATHSFLAEDDIAFFRPLVRDALGKGALEVWVLTTQADAPIGFLGLDGDRIEALFLAPEHRGAGGGRRLVAHAQALRGGELALDVNEQNTAARGFYEALGFEVVGRSELDGTGRPYPLLHMRRAAPPSPPALLVIDVQQGLDHPKYGSRNNPDAERTMAALLVAWRERRWPVIHVQHMSTAPDSPLRPELPGNALKPEVTPLDGEPLFRKSVNSAFIGTELDKFLHDRGIRELFIVGLTTDHCVSATARTASDLGFRVAVISDATATFERTGADGKWYSAEQMHGAALASLHGEFGRVLSSEEVLARMQDVPSHGTA